MLLKKGYTYCDDNVYNLIIKNNTIFDLIGSNIVGKLMLLRLLSSVYNQNSVEIYMMGLIDYSVRYNIFVG